MISHHRVCLPDITNRFQEQKEEVQGATQSRINGHDRGGDGGPEGEPLFQVGPQRGTLCCHFPFECQ